MCSLNLVTVIRKLMTATLLATALSLSSKCAAISHAAAAPPNPTLTTALQTAWQVPLYNLREVDDDRYGHTLQAEIDRDSGRLVRVLNTLRYQSNQQDRFILLFVADPDYSQDCAPCYSQLGVASWIWQGQQWRLERTQRSVETGGFLHDQVPQGSLIQLGANNFGVLFRETGRNDYNVTLRALIIAQVGMARNPWQTVLDKVIAQDNSVYCRQSFAPADAECVRYEGVLRVEQIKSAHWGTLLLNLNGQHLTPDATTPYVEIQRFRFDGRRYALSH